MKTQAKPPRAVLKLYRLPPAVRAMLTAVRQSRQCRRFRFHEGVMRCARLSFEPFVAPAMAGAILAVQVMAWKPRLKTMGTAP